MKNSSQVISISLDLSSVFLAVFNKIFRTINKGIFKTNDKSKRSKVTQVRPPLEQQNILDSTQFETEPKRPKVTSVVAKGGKIMAEPDNYDFIFSIDMNDSEGDIVIIFEFMKEGATAPYLNEFHFNNVDSTTTTLESLSNEVPYFEGLPSGNYIANTFVLWNGESIEPIELYAVELQLIN